MFKLKSSDYTSHHKKGGVNKSTFHSSKPKSGGIGIGEEPKDILKCPVCLEQYTEESGKRVPLFLSCHHTVCRSCLPKLSRPHLRHSHAKEHKEYKEHKENGSELSCPQCRVVTLVPPAGLSQNFYIMQVLIKKKRRTSGDEGALRMWCRDCEAIAMEGCSHHEVTQLTGVLKQLADSCLVTRTNLSTILKVRSQKQGESARRLREAVDQIDRASASLRRRLVTYLDRATLAHATASSLLQEVDKMCEQVELGSFLQNKGQSALTTSPSAPEMVEASTRSSHNSANNSPNIGNRLSSLYPDVRDLHRTSSSELTRAALFEPTIEGSLGAQEMIHFVDGSSQYSYSNLSSSLETCNSALRELSCSEQEDCIVDLRECLTVMTRMQQSLRDDQQNQLPKPINAEDGICPDKLIEMFKTAIHTLEDCKKSS